MQSDVNIMRCVKVLSCQLLLVPMLFQLVIPKSLLFLKKIFHSLVIIRYVHGVCTCVCVE